MAFILYLCGIIALTQLLQVREFKELLMLKELSARKEAQELKPIL